MMAHFNKIGLLILNKNQTKFLVCEKYSYDMTTDYLMPGGTLDEETEKECLKQEIYEELRSDIDLGSLELIGNYTDVAAGDAEKNVIIKLYKGKIKNQPEPSSEIKAIHWIGKEDINNLRVSLIIRNKIIPDLIEKKILK